MSSSACFFRTSIVGRLAWMAWLWLCCATAISAMLGPEGEQNRQLTLPPHIPVRSSAWAQPIQGPTLIPFENRGISRSSDFRQHGMILIKWFQMRGFDVHSHPVFELASQWLPNEPSVRERIPREPTGFRLGRNEKAWNKRKPIYWLPTSVLHWQLLTPLGATGHVSLGPFVDGSLPSHALGRVGLTKSQRDYILEQVRQLPEATWHPSRTDDYFALSEAEIGELTRFLDHFYYHPANFETLAKRPRADDRELPSDRQHRSRKLAAADEYVQQLHQSMQGTLRGYGWHKDMPVFMSMHTPHPKLFTQDANGNLQDVEAQTARQENPPTRVPPGAGAGGLNLLRIMPPSLRLPGPEGGGRNNYYG